MESRPYVASAPKQQRSRASNGSNRSPNGNRPVILGVDGRSGWIRRWKDIVEDHTSHYGGAEHMGPPRVTLLRHQAVALVEMEQIEARLSDGKATETDLSNFNVLLGNVRRNYQMLGMDRVQKPVSGIEDLGAISAYLGEQSGPEGS